MAPVPALASISALAKRLAADAGFDAAGIAAVADSPELAYFPRWIAEGRAGEMRYLESRTDSGELKRASLASVAPWARSVVVCAINYNTAQPKSVDGLRQTADGQLQTESMASGDLSGREPSTVDGHGWISRYAWSQEDYHDSVLRRLRALEERLQEIEPCESRSYVDTGPLVERVWAKYAGVGWIGKNTCIINQRLGSWLFLGVILTSLELEPDLPAADRCGTCTRCLDACPTDAFLGPHQMDATRCIAYLTIEKRGVVPEEFRAGIGRNVFGCDICQDVCPWNRRAPASAAPEFQPRNGLVNPALDWLAALDEEQFRAAFRKSPVKRAKRAGLRRNVAIAMGNSRDPRFRPQLEEMSRDSDETVAEHARWALQQFEKR